MKRILPFLAGFALSAALCFAPAESQTIIGGGGGGGTSPCSAFGIIAGTCLQGAGNAGTPSAINLTNGTALPLTSITGMAAGVATFLATPSSANLITAVTDETGTGALVFANGPTLIAPILGTIASGNLAAGTGYTVANLAGLGANVGTFLATPSSANLRAALTDETGTGAAFFAGGAAGVFTATSLAIAGCTIGTDGLCVTGTTTLGGPTVLGVAGSTVGSIAVKNATSGTITVSPPTGALGTIALTWPAFAGTIGLSGGVTVMTTSQSPTVAQWATFPTYVVNAGSLLITIPLSTTLNTNSGIAVSAMNAFTLTPNASDAVCAPSCGSNGVGLSISAGQLVYVTTDGANHIYVTNGGGGGGVTSLAGTANQITASASTGAVTLSIPSAFTFPGTVLVTQNGAASAPAVTLNGTIATGTGTTSKGLLYLEPTGTTVPTDLNTSGTAIVVNVGSTAADIFNGEAAGSGTAFRVTGFGQVFSAATVHSGDFSQFCIGGSHTCIGDEGNVDGNLNVLSSASAYGNIYTGSLVSKGATPTLTGTCTTGTKVGGQTAGTFVATCTAQTVIITFLNTAPNGWDCSAQDRTTVADTLKQISSTTTSCTLTGTTVASDVIGWHAIAYLVEAANDNRADKGMRTSY